MSPLRRTIRLFVSSTFSDMKAERDVLQRDVFPRLRQLCLSNALRFQPIDLRWGVPAEAGKDNRTMRICLRELKRCQEGGPKPNFLILLGDRYGWTPLPETIPADVFERLSEGLPDEVRGLCVWSEDQPSDAKGWYRRDDNAIPEVYELRPRGDYEDWHDRVEQPLLRALQAAAQKIGLVPDIHGLFLGISATEQEIVEGALKVDDARNHVHAFFRTIHGLPREPWPAAYADVIQDGGRDPGATARLKNLKTRIKAKIGRRNVHGYGVPWRGADVMETDLDRFAEDVYNALRSVIERQINTLASEPTEAREEATHRAFGEIRRDGFQGRADILDTIAGHLNGNGPGMLAVVGSSGSGKSALIAEAAHRARRTYGEFAVLARFIGATPGSSNLLSLLGDLVGEIRRRYPAPRLGEDGEFGDRPVSIDINSLAVAFQEALTRPTAGRPLFLFLDALDQLSTSNAALECRWLPRGLSPHTRLILSAALPTEPLPASMYGAIEAPDSVLVPPTAPSGAVITALDRRTSDVQWLRLGSLPVRDGRVLLDRWLTQAGRRLLPVQAEAILRSFSSEGNPLWLRTAANEGCQLASWDPAPEFYSALPEFLCSVLNRLSSENEHGATLVERALGGIASARHGLAEDEVMDVLSKDEDVMSEFRRRSPDSPYRETLPLAIWVRLYGDIETFLSEHEEQNTSLLTFYHRSFVEAVPATFSSDEDKEVQHRRLANYFAAQPHDLGDDGKAAPSLRKLAELPFQLARSGKGMESLAFLLEDITFLEAKCRTGGFVDLLQDLEQAQEACSTDAVKREDFERLKRLLRSGARELASRADLALQTLHNVTRWSPDARVWRDRWIPFARQRLDHRGPWIAAEGPLPSSRPLDVTFKDDTFVQAIGPDCTFLAAASGNRVVVVHDLTLGGAFDIRVLPLEPVQRLRALAIENGGGRLAWLIGETVGCEGSQRTHPVRRSENLICWLGSGTVVFARSEGTLAAWNIQTDEVVDLIPSLPAPLAVLSVSTDRQVLLVVAGERRAKQAIFIVERSGRTWLARSVPYDGPPVVDARLCDTPSEALVACQDASLKIIHTETGVVADELLYERRAEARVSGRPVKCAFLGEGTSRSAIVATRDGDVALWRLHADSLTLLSSFGHRLDTCVLLATRPQDGRVLITTAREGWFLAESEPALTPPAHSAEVNACCLLSEESAASISRQDMTLRWWKTYGLKEIKTTVLGPRWTPVSLCPDAGSDRVLFGVEHGTVEVLSPLHENGEMGRQLFRTPVVGLVPDLPTSGVAGSQAGGLCRFVLSDPSQNRVLRNESGDLRLLQILPGKGACWFWTLDEKNGVWGKRYRVAWFDDDAREHLVWRGREVTRRIATSPDGGTLVIAQASRFIIMRARRTGWREQARYLGALRLVAFLSDEWMAVAKDDTFWLEIWRSRDMTAVAALNLGREPSSIAVEGNRLVLGCNTGEVVSLKFRQSDMV